MAQFVELLKLIKSRGQIDPDIEVEDAVFVIYSLIMTDLVAFFVDDDMSIQDCLQSLKRHINLAFKGFKPKNRSEQ